MSTRIETFRSRFRTIPFYLAKTFCSLLEISKATFSDIAKRDIGVAGFMDSPVFRQQFQPFHASISTPYCRCGLPTGDNPDSCSDCFPFSMCGLAAFVRSTSFGRFISSRHSSKIFDDAGEAASVICVGAESSPTTYIWIVETALASLRKTARPTDFSPSHECLTPRISTYPNKAQTRGRRRDTTLHAAMSEPTMPQIIPPHAGQDSAAHTPASEELQSLESGSELQPVNQPMR